MHDTMIAFLFAAATVVLAEMGDKTQLLAMAFAAKYKPAKVMLGVFIATVLNHGLAVVVGNFITRFEHIQIWIRAIAALSFIFFGLWTLRGDKLDGEENKKTRFGPVITVAIAFFLAEMGDKTQLATISLATKFPHSPVGILIGTTTGMLIADGVGIIIGVVLRKKIPERAVKLVSAAVFILFGLIGCYQFIHSEFSISIQLEIAILLILSIISATASIILIRKNNTTLSSANPLDDSICHDNNT